MPRRATPIKVGTLYRNQRRRRAWRSAAGFMGLAAVVGAALGAASLFIETAASQSAAAAEPSSTCTVTDGDTLRCGEERIRLLGIDAPELPGHCRVGRQCAPGDGPASKRSLEDAMRYGAPVITRVGYDHYGRTLATVSVGEIDLSCWQLQHGQAIYKPEWDNGGRVRRDCP